MSQTKAQLIDTLVASLLPATDSSVDIGSNGVRFANIYGDTLYGDGSNLTGITSTTINSNADNRLITGSGSANTLNGESGLTYNGSTLAVTGAITGTGGLSIEGATVFNDAGAGVDFRVEGDTEPNLLFVDASADRVAIGTSSPAALFESRGSTGIMARFRDSANGIIDLKTTGTNNSDPVQIDANNRDLTFAINSGEKMRINSSGLVNIGSGANASGLSPLLHLHKATSNATAYFHITNADTGITNNDGFLFGFNSSLDALIFNKESTPIRFATVGQERMRIDSSGRVLIGHTTSTPMDNDANNPIFAVEGAGNGARIAVRSADATAGNGAFIYLTRTRGTSAGSKTTVQSGDSLGGLIFMGADGTDDTRAAIIQAQCDGTPGDNDMPGRLVFMTTPDGGINSSERMRITSDGKVGIGTTSPSRNLDVIGTIGIKNSSGAQWYVDRNDSNGRFELYQSNGSANDGRKLNLTTDGQLEVGELQTEAGRGRVAIKAKNDDGGTPVNLYLQEVSGGEGYGLGVDGDGDLNFYNSGGSTPSFEIGDDDNVTVTSGNLIMGTSGKGISFAATGGPTSGSGSSELFDDYEEGTFTPEYNSGSSAGACFAGTISYDSQVGHYTKVGNVVSFQLKVDPSSSGLTAKSGILQINNLPYTCKNVQSNGGAFYVLTSAFNATSVLPNPVLVTNNNAIQFYKSNAGNFAGNELPAPANYIQLAGLYLTD